MRGKFEAKKTRKKRPWLAAVLVLAVAVIGFVRLGHSDDPQSQEQPVLEVQTPQKQHVMKITSAAEYAQKRKCAIQRLSDRAKMF